MRICFLAPANSPHSRRWIRFFAEAGHEVHWLSLDPATEEMIPGVDYGQFPGTRGGPFGLLAKAWRVRRRLRRIRPDVLHVHSAGTYGLAGLLAGFRPTIVTAWGSDVLVAGRSPFTGPLVRRALRAADLVTCDASHMREAMRRMGVQPRMIEVVHFGVETDRFTPGPADRDLRRRLGGEGRLIVLSLRSLEPVYDLESLVRAAELVVPAIPSARFLLAGAGSQESRLRAMVDRLSLKEHVVFLGKIPHARLVEHLRLADVYVSTSLSDAGLAASTAEAMSCGIVPVVTDSGENGLWIEDGLQGFVVPCRAPQALAGRILRLLADAGLRRAMGRAAREGIVERNDHRREMGRMESLCELVVSRAAQGP